jgi:sRNA-binding carbon storage regulator CsrA
MLVLSRRKGVRIRLKGPVEAIALGADAGQVKLGVCCFAATDDSQ